MRDTVRSFGRSQRSFGRSQRSFGRFKRFHLIGIGGIGMSGLAELLLRMGYAVTGSDLRRSGLTDRLERLGAVVHEGHEAAYLENADVVVYSSAVPSRNPERVAARTRGTPAIPRAELLAAFLHGRYGIAVAGTHGKTTTTAMIGVSLIEAGLDPTLIVGGVVPALGANVRLGAGTHVVAEADEYDRSFLALSPELAIITTVDADHLACYKSLEAIEQAFIAFAHSVPFHRPVVLNGDDPGAQRIRPSIRRRTVTYGFASGADIRATQMKQQGFHTECTVRIGEKRAGALRLPCPGRHHVENGLAAVAVGHILDIPFERTQSALETFSGVARRFEIKGRVDGITVIDDYAHHPAEIAATLGGLQNAGEGRMVVVFQPHLYSRTQDFSDAFGNALARADIVVVTEVYASRERAIPGVSGALIVQAARRHGGRDVLYIPEKEEVTEALVARLRPGDRVLTMGAGDVGNVGTALLRALNARRGTS